MSMDLAVCNLVKAYGDRRVLSGLSLSLAVGATLAVTGPSGAGKSTLLQIVGSLDVADTGTVTLGEHQVTGITGDAAAAFRACVVGFIFQDHYLLPQLSAIENILVPAAAAARLKSTPTKIDRARLVDRAQTLLEKVGLGDRASAFPAELSGGERQRIAVARSMMNHPALLLCDEPTGSLDEHTGHTVLDLILHTAQDENASVLMVTHNAQHAARMDRTMRLSDGLLVAV